MLIEILITPDAELVTWVFGRGQSDKGILLINTYLSKYSRFGRLKV